MTEQEAIVDWDGLLVRLLHETQLHIIEAMLWIDRPMSATELAQVFDGSLDIPKVSYHVRRLRDLRVLKQSWIKKGRGAEERFYRLATVGK